MAERAPRTTSRFEWPVPGDDGPADAVTVVGDGLDAVDSTLGEQVDAIVPQFVSSLPANPADGEVVYFLADATAGVVWQLRYRGAGTTSPYRWEFVGGPPLYVDITAQENLTSPESWRDLNPPATVGPQIALPLAGDYFIAWGAMLYTTNVAGAIAGVGVARGSILPAYHANPNNPDVAAMGTGPQRVSVSRSRRYDGLAPAGLNIRLVYFTNNAPAYVGSRWLQITPIRVQAVGG